MGHYTYYAILLASFVIPFSLSFDKKVNFYSSWKFVFPAIIFLSSAHAQTNLKLWYNKPASIWEEALPLGNAKTGAMVFGGVVELNDAHRILIRFSMMRSSRVSVPVMTR